MGTVFWAIPTIKDHRAGYGVYALSPRGRQRYRFIDGAGEEAYWGRVGAGADVDALGEGPGAGATDPRVPELGNDLSIVKTSRVTMADALAQVEAQNGPSIEAKFELGDDGKLSLSI